MVEVDEKKVKVTKTTVSLEGEDMDILDFFSRKGWNSSVTVRTALRTFYEWYAKSVTQGPRYGNSGSQEEVVEL